MIVLQTIAVAFAMFSAVPVPQFAWNEKNMRYALCAFPLVGLLCGALWCACGVLPLPAPARAAGFCLVPVWVTGGIHLDGYADTCDALASYGDREKKLEILKTRTAASLPSSGCAAILRLTSALPPACSSPPGWARCGRWHWCWSGHFPALRWRPFPWPKIPALHTPLPLPPTAPPCAMCWRCWWCCFAGRCLP